MKKKLLILVLVLIVLVSVILIINSYFNIVDLSDIFGLNKKEFIRSIEKLENDTSVKSLEQYSVIKTGGDTSISIKKYDTVNKVIYETEGAEDNLSKEEIYIFKKDNKTYRFYGNEENGFTEDTVWEQSYNENSEQYIYTSFLDGEKLYSAVIYIDVDELKEAVSGVKKTYDKDGVVTYEFKYESEGIEPVNYSMTFENGLITKASYNNYDSNNKMTRIEANIELKNMNNTVIKIPQTIIDMIH